MWPFNKSKSAYVLPKLPPVRAEIPMEIPLTEEMELPEPPKPASPRRDSEAKLEEIKASELPPLELPESILPQIKQIEPPNESPPPLDNITLWLSNGVVVKSLEELFDAIAAMNEATFHYHVNAERNDIANWIQDVIGDKELAMKLAPVHKREDFLNILQQHVSRVAKTKKPKAAQETSRFAYLGLRGMATSLDPAADFIGFRATAKSRDKPLQKRQAAAKVAPSPVYAKKALEQLDSINTSSAELKTVVAPEVKMPELKEVQKTERRAFIGGEMYAKHALQELDSMNDAEVILTRIQPKGTMLAEILRRKKVEKAIMQAKAIVPAQDHRLTVTSIKTPEVLPKLSVKPALKPKVKTDAQQHDMLIQTLEQAKQKAEESDITTAKQLIAQAKSIIKTYFHGDRKPFQYYIWDAENSLKRAQLI